MLCCSKGVDPKKNESVYNPVLAKGWQEYWSTEYKLPYYYHKKLKKTQWEHPGYTLPNGKKLLTKNEKGELKEGIRKVEAKPVTCFFKKGPLGLKLREDMDNEGNIFIEVHEISPNEQAGQEGLISEKMRLLSVAGNKCAGRELTEIMVIVKTAKRPLEMQFIRPPQKQVTIMKKELVKPLIKPSVAQQPEPKAITPNRPQKPTLMEKVYSFQEGPIGLSLQDGFDPDGSQFVEVMSKHEGGQAANEPSLHLHDRITRVGQTSVIDLDFAHVMVILKEAKRPVELAFVSPPGGHMDELKFTFLPGPMGIVLGDGIVESVGRAPVLFVEVMDKVPGSQADGFSDLHIHDRIVRVGDVSVKGLDFAHVMEVIQGATRPIELSFFRPTDVAVTESQTAVVSAPKFPAAQAGTPAKKGGKKGGGKKRSTPKTPKTGSSNEIAQESTLQEALSTPGVRSPSQVEADLSTPSRAEPSSATDKPDVAELPSVLENRDIKSSAPPPPLEAMPEPVEVEKPADAVLENRDIKSSAPPPLPKAMPEPVGVEKKPINASTPTRARGSSKAGGGKRGGGKAGSKAGGTTRRSVGVKKKK